MSPVLLGIIIGFVVVAAVVIFVTKSKSAPAIALNSPAYQPFKLISRTAVSPNTFLFRFALQSSKTRLGLPIGRHMLLRFHEDKADPTKAPISRAYTPVTNDNEL